MTEEQVYFIDIISLVPANSILYVQAPSLENSAFLQFAKISHLDYYKQITLTSYNKAKLIELVELYNIDQYFQTIEIHHDNHVLLKCYDGLVIGEFSRTRVLPDEFYSKYEELGMLRIAEDW